MSTLKKYLSVIYVCLLFTYAVDIFEQGTGESSLTPQLIMLAFVNISVVMAFFSKKWFGQILLFTNFILVGLIPLVLGAISQGVKDQRVILLFKCTCVVIPLLLIVFGVVSYFQGNVGSTVGFDYRIVIYRVIQAVYWYSVYMYVSIYLKEKLQTIDKVDNL